MSDKPNTPPAVCEFALQERAKLLSDNADLRARLAKYEDAEGLSFQGRVMPWLLECFGAEIASDTVERNHRFLEEALELVQACGCPADESHKLVDYVYGRPVGEKSQEVGGVMVTLAALCLAQGLDMHTAGETELARITQPAMVERIREKQKRKPAMSPLPGAYPERATLKTQPSGVGLPDGWVQLTIEHEPGYPEDVAFGPQRMMDRLKKWLDRYFEMRLNSPPVSAGGVDERAADDPCSCTDGRCGTRPNSFARETRYVVFKLNKLNQKQLARLNDLLNVSGPDGYALPTVECVVVEHDWPEYGPTWAAIEARVMGVSAPSHGEQVREGWKLVPVTPTNAMTHIGQSLRYDSVNSIGHIYRQMLAAAPSAGSQEKG